MARIRNISPRFFEDETMAKLPMGGRLLYIGLWTRADLNGVFEWSPKVITAGLFPNDDDVTTVEVVAWLSQLQSLNRVVCFEYQGKRYGHIPQFKLHQCISKAERDNDLRAREAGRVTMPVIGTVPITVIGTVLITPDVGRMTDDAGQVTHDKEIVAAAPVAKAPKVKTEVDLILAKHRFKFDGPARNHKTAANEILKTITADELDEFLTQLAAPLWPPRMVAEAIRWSALPLAQTGGRTQSEIDASHAFIDSIDPALDHLRAAL